MAQSHYDQIMSVDDLLPPAQNFTVPLAEKVRARGGLPEHLYRLGVIERLITRYINQLREKPDAKLDLSRLNELIDKHNRYYPIEASLPIDTRTGGVRGFKPMEPVTIEWLRGRL
jgi:hypothetical protein